MAKNLDRIQTLVIVMMENRSFDHILGYLSLPEFQHPAWARIDGVRQAQLYYAHDPYPPRPLTSPSLDPDPPHEREDIAIQLNPPLGGRMHGFIDSYKRVNPGARLAGVMEYCTPKDVPVTDFLARNFAICDNWFSCIPASTLPNRLMAMSGYALVDHTPDGYLQIVENLFYDDPDNLLYEWLDKRGVSWRLYHSGTFFFMQMPRLALRYEADDGLLFRPLDSLAEDFARGDVPQVVFVEPLYEDDPRRGNAQATDDHAPASIWGGQRFLKMVYEAISSNQDVWSNLAAVVTYDEHGSFFDHVYPPAIKTEPPANARYTDGFGTLGVRVPAIVVSPFVGTGSLCESLLDHTSILKFIGEKFGGGKYTPLVDARPVGSMSEALSEGNLASSAPVAPPPAMP